METFIIIAEIISMIFSVAGFLAFVLIINIILNAHKNNPYYEKKNTIMYFRYLFFIMAILDTLLIVDQFFKMGREWITVIFVLRAIVTIITVINYYMEIHKFTDKQIPWSKHEETINKVISEFQTSTLSPEVKQKMIDKLENYKKNER